MFWLSMSPVEQEHIIRAYTFELGKCYEQAIKERQLQALANIDPVLCSEVATGLGLPAPEPTIPLADATPSPALSQVGGEWPPDGRMVGIVIDPAGDLSGVTRAAGGDLLGRHGAAADRAPRRRWPKDLAGATHLLDRSVGGVRPPCCLAGCPAPAPDAIPARESEAGASSSPTVDPRVLLLIEECWRHAKMIGAWGEGVTAAGDRRHHRHPGDRARRHGRRRARRACRSRWRSTARGSGSRPRRRTQRWPRQSWGSRPPGRSWLRSLAGAAGARRCAEHGLESCSRTSRRPTLGSRRPSSRLSSASRLLLASRASVLGQRWPTLGSVQVGTGRAGSGVESVPAIAARDGRLPVCLGLRVGCPSASQSRTDACRCGCTSRAYGPGATAAVARRRRRHVDPPPLCAMLAVGGLARCTRSPRSTSAQVASGGVSSRGH